VPQQNISEKNRCLVSYAVIAIYLFPYKSMLRFSRCSAPPYFREETMDPKKTALVLIEYQNDFTSRLLKKSIYEAFSL
jgi:hypothetical protein